MPGITIIREIFHSICLKKKRNYCKLTFYLFKAGRRFRNLDASAHEF